jgi:D-alanyl-D-alanine carboxypeptidase/D-alanyl-D-alanine-endopeptidase (penicillin-binding protein 4)
MTGARGAVAAALASALVAGPALGVSTGTTPAPLSAALTGWTAANPATSAAVWRLDPSGPVQVLAYKPDTPRRPASTLKILTAASALLALSPNFRFETRLYAGVNTTQNGAVLTGPLYLKGYGDPTLSTPQYARRYLHGYGGNLGRLATPLRAAGVRVVRGPLVVDETIFDTIRRGPTWPARYTTECQPLSGISVNQSYLGEQRGRYVKSPSRAAGNRLRIAWKRLGIVHRGTVRTGRAPAQGRLIATATSPPLRVITGLMLPSSDNYLAEMLVKNVGAYTRGTGSTAAGSAAATSLLSGKGLLRPSDRLVDGSGLALDNRLTATSLVRVLAAAEAEPSWGSTLIDSLPRGGEGTLRRRLLDPVVRSRVRAKTGYLDRTSTLAGIVEGRSGIRYAFAILMNQGSISGAKATQDRLVTLLASGVADGA